jgi:beta-N-acetylhexosaminidase
MKKKVWIGFIVLLVLISTGHAQSKKSQWVDSVFSTLDLSGKIGQVLMVPVNSYSNQLLLEKMSTQLKKYKIGGVVFTKGGIASQVNTTNHFQLQVSIPLLIGMHSESGLGAVLDSAILFPPPIMLGSVHDDSLMFFLGAEIGRQLKIMGVQVNFGPTTNTSASLNTNDISHQLYGEDKDVVSRKLAAYQTGLQTSKILSIGNHYPSGSGVNENLFALEQLYKNDLAGIMMYYKHDQIFPDQKKIFKTNSAELNRYSPAYLKQKLNFDRLIFSSFTDSTGVNKKIKVGDAEVSAFKNGSDMILSTQNISATIRRIRKSIRKNKQLQLQLDLSTKKILGAKFEAGLNKKTIVNTDNLYSRINTPASEALKSVLLEKSITVVKDQEQLLPMKQLDNISFASISIGRSEENSFTKFLSKYAPFNHYKIERIEDTVGLALKLQPYSTVVIGIYPNSKIEESNISILQKINERSKVIAVNFDSPSKLKLLEKFPTIVQAYADDEQIQQFIPQLIFGAKRIDGIMPVSVNENIKQGQGIQTATLGRMGYSIPEAEGLDSKTLKKISIVANEAITQRAAPGCQVLVARHGKIIYEKTFGSQTYENKIPVNDQTIYDLASLTKVTGTLQAVMFLYEKGLIDIYKKASFYLPELLNTNKKDIILKDILAHQSGLFPFLLMWPQTVKGDTLLAHYYSPMKTESHPLQVAPNLFASTVMKDSIWQWILKSEMLVKPPRTPYSTRYSDLGFMILHRIVERLVNQPMEDFLSQNVYEPLGASTVGYLPLTKFSPSQIAPTERDTIFRKSIVLGTVHDERAAMLGGIAGHAGLFGSGTDLIKIGQMLLQNGSYGSQSFYKPETVELFAQKQFDNSTRGLGWAKTADPNSPSSRFLSPKGFGHTGFTGTCMWIDPEFDLVFVFLSNSRFPDRSGKLNTTNIRSRIQDAVYQSIFNYCQYGDALPDEKLLQYLRKSSN